MGTNQEKSVKDVVNLAVETVRPVWRLGTQALPAGPAVYVGTYGKYNSGSLKGAWLSLADYTDKEAFLSACHELHRDEADATGVADPELMFQDWQGLPAGLVCESFIDEAVWEWLGMTDNERECVMAWMDGVDSSERDLWAILERFQGYYGSRVDWAYEYIDSTGMLEGVPEFARNYFDYESFARDAFLNGDVVEVRHNGQLFIFSNQ